jgi:integrase
LVPQVTGVTSGGVPVVRNQQMTTRPVPPALAKELAGLPDTDLTRILALIAANHAPATLTIYGYAWRQWQAWAADRGLDALPATAASVCAYLAERAEKGASYSSLEVACAAISYQHRQHGADNPVLHDAVRQVRRGLRRTLGSAPRRQARPLSVTDIRQLVTAIDRTTPLGARDAALILLGYASALRRSELAGLTLADLETKPAGLLLTVHHSKTDPQGHGQVVGVTHGQQAATDPIAAVNSWLAVRGTADGPLFTSLRSQGPALTPISGQTVARIVTKRAAAAGLPTDRITGHSLRAGHVTSAALAGVSVDRIAAQTRHQRIDVLIEHYIRPIDALQTSSSKDLGL